MRSVRRHEQLRDEGDTMIIERLWLSLPIFVRAVLAGIAVAAAGALPWAGLVSANIRHESALPWAVPTMAVYLWLCWRYFVRGRGWARATAETRGINFRATRPPAQG